MFKNTPSAKPVSGRLLIPLAIVLLLLASGGGFVLVDAQKRIQNQSSQQALGSASNELSTLLGEQADALVALEEVILHDEGLRDALKTRSRERLLADHSSIFALLREKHGITHFYFHDASRVNLLRIHKPERHGDLINRFTAREAERTSQTATGIEIGPLGTFTLRAVQPVFDGDALIGYLELGKEIEDALTAVCTGHHVEVAVAIHKTELDQTKWEAGMKMLDRDADWERIADDALIYSSLTPYPSECNHFIGKAGDSIAEATFNGKPWRVMSQPLKDVSGTEVGNLIVMSDISVAKANFNRLLARVAGLTFVILGGLTGLLYVLLHKTDESIRAQQTELREARNYTDNILSSMAEMLIVTSPDGSIVTVNQAARAVLGYREHELLGQPASLLFEENEDEEYDIAQPVLSQGTFPINREVLHSLEKKGHINNIEKSLRAKDGHTIPVLLSGSAMCDEHGEVRGIVFLARDITQRKRAEVEMHSARKAAEAANIAKSDFLANMSHEIRTPMTAIIGFAETMLDGDQKESERLSCIHTIRRNGDYLLRLINDILDLSKIEAGKMEFERVPVEPCRIITEVVSLMLVRASAKGLLLKTEYIGAIPATIQGDPTRLRQILINIIGNAIKFTETGSVHLVTRLMDDGDEPYLQYDVIDSGCGMTEEQKSKLFQPFMQGDTSTTRKFGGTGLGLTISKRFAELLGGDITVAATEMGIGTTFRVTVATGALDGVKMLADPKSVTVVADTGRKNAKISPSGLEALRILLVEDGPDNQRLISFILKKAGADVTMAENGQVALDKVRDAYVTGASFDVILMDMQMPVLDGYRATQQLRQENYAGPIIALTAHAMAEDGKKCLDAGCDDYATKPVDREKLIALVAQYATQRASDESLHTT